MPSVEQVPYEILFRYKLGELQGAHVAFSYLVTADDGAKTETPLGPQPVDIGQGQGFPLADILGQTLTDALVANATLTASVTTLTAEKAELTAQLQAALSRVTELEQQLAACQSEDA